VTTLDQLIFVRAISGSGAMWHLDAGRCRAHYELDTFWARRSACGQNYLDGNTLKGYTMRHMPAYLIGCKNCRRTMPSVVLDHLARGRCLFECDRIEEMGDSNRADKYRQWIREHEQ
jgi:hypothetical protein